jgi:glycosyltransferase involved in cell wall biosynthesis
VKYQNKEIKKMQTLSFCSIVKNEEKNIKNMLENIKDIADEIIIVDTGSSDNTIKIAKEYNSKIFYYRWNDNFSEARNYSIKKATKDWCFIIDADEILIKKENIKKYLYNNSINTLYMLRVIHPNNSDISLGSISHSNSRLFPNNGNFQYYGKIHEHIIYIGEHNYERKLILDSEIYHFGFINKEISKKKSLRNIEFLKDEIEYHKNTPYHYYLHFLLAKEYSSLDMFDEAINSINYLLEYKNFDESIIINSITLLLKLLIKKNDITSFENISNKYKNILLKNPDFCILYSYFCIINSKYEKAKQICYKALHFKVEKEPYIIYDISSTTWKAYYLLGISYFHTKDLNKSEKYFLKALEYIQNDEIISYLEKIKAFRFYMI